MGAKKGGGRRRVRLEPHRISRRAEFLILGGAGLVGSHLRAALRGRSVLWTWFRRPVPGGAPLDITDPTAVRDLMSLVRPRIVILAAADANVERCEREPEAARRVNVDAARSVIEAAREIAASVVVFSSEYVFDGRYGPYSEDDATRPINEYGRQKVTLESLAQSLQRHLVCRTSGVFGWEPAGKNFVCQLIRRLRSGSEFVVPSDQVITPTYAPELSRAVVGLLDRSVSGTIHVVGPRVLARAAFARLAARAFGLPENLISERPTAELGLGAPRPLNAGLRDGRLRAMLGDALLEPAAALAAMRAAEGAA